MSRLFNGSLNLLSNEHDEIIFTFLLRENDEIFHSTVSNVRKRFE